MISGLSWSLGFLFFQLKVDEFESHVNEVKDPFPPADFPGMSPVQISQATFTQNVNVS